MEVNVAADTLIATSSSSVGSVLPESKIRDLPLAYRNRSTWSAQHPALGIGRHGGVSVVGNFAGARIGQVNTTRDGISVSDGRYDIGIYSATYMSQDLVDEVRVIVAPADAEIGRGSGQIQLSTRSGTNQFRGSVFWVNRNRLWMPTTGLPISGMLNDYSNRNQMADALVGRSSRTRHFSLSSLMANEWHSAALTGPVLTAQARQGIFRFFPGVQNGNAIANNHRRPDGKSAQTGRRGRRSVAHFNVFTRDAQRAEFDASGYIKRSSTECRCRMISTPATA